MRGHENNEREGGDHSIAQQTTHEQHRGTDAERDERKPSFATRTQPTHTHTHTGTGASPVSGALCTALSPLSHHSHLTLSSNSLPL